MAFIPGPGLVQVTLNFSQSDGELAKNTFGVDTGSGVEQTVSELTTLANVFGTWFGTGDGAGHIYSHMLSTHAQLLSITAKDLTTDSSPEVVLPDPVVGLDAGVVLPNGVTFTITHRTGTAGRSNRGRTYLVGMTAAIVDGSDQNKAASGPAGNLVSMMTPLIADVAALAGHKLAVLSRSHNLVPRAAIHATPVTSFGYSDLFLDYQRRRAPGHNRHH